MGALWDYPSLCDHNTSRQRKGKGNLLELFVMDLELPGYSSDTARRAFGFELILSNGRAIEQRQISTMVQGEDDSWR